MAAAKSSDLYRKYRPKSFDEVFGQDKAVKTLQGFLRDGNVPRAILFSGPPGCGKTSLAYIMKREMGCADLDFEVISAAQDRGIDKVRAIQMRMRHGLRANSPCRIWLFDEAHSLTPEAQEALLHPLESDKHPNCYFFFCTTRPHKLIETISDQRCSHIKLTPLKREDLARVVRQVVGRRDIGAAIPRPIDRGLVNGLHDRRRLCHCPSAVCAD
jgi:DNA polymerase-3 subunit gamma/tau